MLAAGATAPDFTLPQLDGKPWKLSEAIRKGRVLLAFFKTTCPTCQFTLPFLDRIGDGLQVFSISQDESKGTGEFKLLFHANAPTLLDAGPRYEVSNAYGITHVPSLFVVETDGKISKAFDGFNKADLESLGVTFRDADRAPAMRPG